METHNLFFQLKKRLLLRYVLKKKFFSLAGEHKQTLGRTKKRAGTYKYKYNGKELQDELGLMLQQWIIVSTIWQLDGLIRLMS